MNRHVHINGIIQTDHGFALHDFLMSQGDDIPLGILTFDTYEQAVKALANRLFPKSYQAYLLAVANLTPTYDIWNNLVTTGHAYGVFDHQAQRFYNARQLGMSAASDMEIAYIEALDATYQSLVAMSTKQA